MRLSMDRSFYTSTYSKVAASSYGGDLAGFEAYQKLDAGSRPLAMVFYGKKAKPVWHFRFKSEEEMGAAIQKAADHWKAQITAKEVRQAEKKAFVHSVKVGDVFGTNWGYEQTNREFFQVIEVKGKRVLIKELAQTDRNDPGYGPMAGKTSYIRDTWAKTTIWKNGESQQIDVEPVWKLVLEGNSIKFASYRWGNLVTDEQNAQGFYVSWGH